MRVLVAICLALVIIAVGEVYGGCIKYNCGSKWRWTFNGVPYCCNSGLYASIKIKRIITEGIKFGSPYAAV
ncbi:hypothetical protein RRG08_059225 [Elysia crispata]|uniref:Uncharacterized protein n=1 Tax=Elysia crispata TaxID=231223 RepID=A0AAE0ZEL5_9GAST|nr:hypothetical protein RRG08_059225 [Elysia crispata]